MHKTKIDFTIPVLIVKSFQQALNENEKTQLHQWLEADDENQALYQKLKDVDPDERKLFFEKLNKTQAWENIYKATQTSKTRTLPVWLKYVAAILLPVLLGGLVYYFVNIKDAYNSVDVISKLEAIKPGTRKAIITLSDGQQLKLDNTIREEILLRNNQFEIKDSSNIIVYKSKPSSLKPERNNVYVPIGGEYKVTLSDGTRVWLNSDTKFDFPLYFAGNKRIVNLEGEAFFEVAENKTKPFIVKTRGIDVEVLGTSFNISAYKNDDHITTTLVEGKLRVSSALEEMILEPGFQSKYKDNVLTSKKVNPDFYTDWKEGLFRFEYIRLQDLTKQLSRWYEIDFFYDSDKLKEVKFNGAVKKDNPLSTIMTILKETKHVNFVVLDSAILIKK